MPLSFRSLSKEDLPELRSWFKDAELSRRTSYPTDEWYAYVNGDDRSRCWLAVDEGEIVAQIQVDLEEETACGYLDIYMRPALRGNGSGTRVLSAFLSGPGSSYAVLEGRIAPDNTASRICCSRCGFTILEDTDSDGFLRAVRQAA